MASRAEPKAELVLPANDRRIPNFEFFQVTLQRTKERVEAESFPSAALSSKLDPALDQVLMGQDATFFLTVLPPCG